MLSDGHATFLVATPIESLIEVNRLPELTLLCFTLALLALFLALDAVSLEGRRVRISSEFLGSPVAIVAVDQLDCARGRFVK